HDGPLPSTSSPTGPLFTKSSRCDAAPGPGRREAVLRWRNPAPPHSAPWKRRARDTPRRRPVARGRSQPRMGPAWLSEFVWQRMQQRRGQRRQTPTLQSSSPRRRTTQSCSGGPGVGAGCGPPAEAAAAGDRKAAFLTSTRRAPPQFLFTYISTRCPGTPSIPKSPHNRPRLLLPCFSELDSRC
ncbi:unnamed protein product, partial [Urochloa humidicola]